ncbi:MAG: ribonuclease PH [Deltaproteobacteria bacterium]|nr:ribonuclease PH [Deltaproteobacteria bacterium]
MTTRKDGRAPTELRKIELITDYTKWAEGSVLTSFGDTRVLCTATLDEKVPPWMKGQGTGWVTAEYSMLPRATDKRNSRESVQGKIGGRTHEISRLIGRALRGALDLEALGERTITLDCDVIQADGGTRTAAITGAWVALKIALMRTKKRGGFDRDPIKRQVAAVSLGVKNGEVLLDLAYEEDQAIDTDLNLVMTSEGGIVEVQATAEGTALARAELDSMLELGKLGIGRLFEAQRAAVDAAKR